MNVKSPNSNWRPDHRWPTTLPAKPGRGGTTSWSRPLRVAVRTAGDTATLILIGDLVEGSDRQSHVLGDSVDRLAASGKRLIVLDLCAVRCVDAMGIGQLANAYLRARAHQADLKLYRPRPELEHMLAVTKLQTIIEVCRTDDPTLDEASRQGRRDASFYGTDTTHYASLQLLSVPA